MLSTEEKQLLARKLVEALSGENEVCRIVVFGSFWRSDDPHDMDVAIFQDSDEKYLPLSLKYRRKTREIARTIPLDIIPLKAGVKDGSFLAEIEQGIVLGDRLFNELPEEVKRQVP
jgi:predicted nucleotidyltransferase